MTPQGYTTLTASLVCRDAAAQLDFLARAFGAVVRVRLDRPSGRVGHAEVQVGSAVLMLGDEWPTQGKLAASTIGGSPVGFFLYVDDVDAALARAVGAGAAVKQPAQEMFWGDRVAVVVCPEGLEWTLAQRVRQPSPDELMKGKQAFDRLHPG